MTSGEFPGTFRMQQQTLLSFRFLPGRVGIQIERSLRLFCYLLDKWLSFTGQRKVLYNREYEEKYHDCMHIIHFSKLSMFAWRIWNTAFENFKEAAQNIASGNSDQNESDIITFPLPYQRRQDKHGPRLSRSGSHGPFGHIFLIPMIYQLQESCDYKLLDIRPYSGSANNPEHHLTEVRPGDPITEADASFLRGFSSLEIDLIRDLAQSLRHLGRSHLRALGTHDDYLNTRADILKEYKDMNSFIRGTVENMSSGSCFLHNSEQMMEFAEEAWRKSVDNRKEYSEAFKLMQEMMSNDIVRDAFSSCQQEPELIWEAHDLPELAKRSIFVNGISKYIRALAYFRTRPTERHESNRKSKESLHSGYLWRDGVELLNNSGRTDFPRDMRNVFEEGTQIMNSRIRQLLLDELNSVTRWIEEQRING